jgi:hypothetical protein
MTQESGWVGDFWGEKKREKDNAEAQSSQRSAEKKEQIPHAQKARVRDDSLRLRG